MATIGSQSSDPPAMPSICVFHLVWAPLGRSYLEEFLASYAAHPAGIPHRLCILFNGFTSAEQLASFRSLLAEVPHGSIVFDEPVQDIGAYLQAIEQVDADHVCFVNSYARFRAAGWLAKLWENLSPDSVGLVGATGSFESHLTNFRVHYRFNNLALGRNCFKWPMRLGDFLRLRADEQRLLRQRQANYAPFPNPHLRTNAFMIRRQLFSDLGFDAGAIRSKEDAYLFESGIMGLTGRVLKAGLDALIVGRDGRGYRIADWPASRTFGAADQENLLVTDNQTGGYAAADPERRRLISERCWGRGEVRSRPADA